jgi:hypothetical protein
MSLNPSSQEEPWNSDGMDGDGAGGASALRVIAEMVEFEVQSRASEFIDLASPGKGRSHDGVGCAFIGERASCANLATPRVCLSEPRPGRR